jgi:hypothetical protein
MDNKTIMELGFSMKKMDDSTVIVEGVVNKNVSKKNKSKYEKQFSKVALHLYDKDYIERLQKIEIELVNSDGIARDSIKDCFIHAARLLMK